MSELHIQARKYCKTSICVNLRFSSCEEYFFEPISKLIQIWHSYHTILTTKLPFRTAQNLIFNLKVNLRIICSKTITEGSSRKILVICKDGRGTWEIASGRDGGEFGILKTIPLNRRLNISYLLVRAISLGSGHFA